MNANSPIKQDITPIKKKFNEPVGAIWAKNWNARNSILNYMNNMDVTCPSCSNHFHLNMTESQINDAFRSHTLTVKIKVLREKFIAVENRQKTTNTQPDYFLHIYQSHTGAAPVYLFSNDGTGNEKGSLHTGGSKTTNTSSTIQTAQHDPSVSKSSLGPTSVGMGI